MDREYEIVEEESPSPGEVKEAKGQAAQSGETEEMLKSIDNKMDEVLSMLTGGEE